MEIVVEVFGVFRPLQGIAVAFFGSRVEIAVLAFGVCVVAYRVPGRGVDGGTDAQHVYGFDDYAELHVETGAGYGAPVVKPYAGVTFHEAFVGGDCGVGHAFGIEGG